MGRLSHELLASGEYDVDTSSAVIYRLLAKIRVSPEFCDSGIFIAEIRIIYG
jgi:hypothetical protein